MNSARFFSRAWRLFDCFYTKALTQHCTIKKVLARLTSNFQVRCIVTSRTFAQNIVTNDQVRKNLLHPNFSVESVASHGQQQHSDARWTEMTGERFSADWPQLLKEDAREQAENSCKLLLQKNSFIKVMLLHCNNFSTLLNRIKFCRCRLRALFWPENTKTPKIFARLISNCQGWCA